MAEVAIVKRFVSASFNVAMMLERLGDHLKQIHALHRHSVSLVGWSFGGICARQVAAKYAKLCARSSRWRHLWQTTQTPRTPDGC